MEGGTIRGGFLAPEHGSNLLDMFLPSKHKPGCCSLEVMDSALGRHGTPHTSASIRCLDASAPASAARASASNPAAFALAGAPEIVEKLARFDSDLLRATLGGDRGGPSALGRHKAPLASRGLSVER